jgi:hypothetical protein
MKGQLVESYRGYFSSVTQVPVNMSHEPDAMAAVVHPARSAATTAAEITAQYVIIIPILQRRRRSNAGEDWVRGKGSCDGQGVGTLREGEWYM